MTGKNACPTQDHGRHAARALSRHRARQLFEPRRRLASPRPTIDAIKSQLADVSENGSVNFRDWLAVKESARRLVASMLGARPEQVAFMRNTSDGLSTVANGLAWRPGDNLVTFRREFPSNIYPWLRAA